MEKRFPIYVTERQGEALRNLLNQMERAMPYGINERSLMWPEIQVAQRLAANIMIGAKQPDNVKLIATQGEKA
jgi:hypothetical protein